MSVAFPITMMVTGFVGNALAMLLVSRSYRRRESKRKKSFLLCIGWLALTDMVGQLLTSPVVILVYLSQRRWEHLDPSGRLCTFFGLAMTVFGLSSLLVASAMAVERALAIRAPHWYASHMKTRATRAVLLGVWLAVLAFALLPVLGVGRYSVQWPGTWCFISTGPAGNETDSAREPGSVAFASAFACLGLLSLIVTFACNLATIKALVSRCRAKAAASQSSAQWGRITTETAIQLMGIMCVLSVCWSPLLVSSCECGAFVATSGKWKLLKVYGTPSAGQAAAPAASGCSLQPSVSAACGACKCQPAQTFQEHMNNLGAEVYRGVSGPVQPDVCLLHYEHGCDNNSSRTTHVVVLISNLIFFAVEESSVHKSLAGPRS